MDYVNKLAPLLTMEGADFFRSNMLKARDTIGVHRFLLTEQGNKSQC